MQLLETYERVKHKQGVAFVLNKQLFKGNTKRGVMYSKVPMNQFLSWLRIGQYQRIT